ncbi:MAG: TIR domain-containing protein [Ignavibacteriales bacterium]|nr:TIR domain-containing protein [Ignavibacteriales bacterium]
MSKDNFLFHKYNLDSAINFQFEKVSKRIAKLSSKDVSSESIAQIAEQIYNEYAINPIELIEGAVSASVEEAKVDVSGDTDRYIRDRSRPFYLPGIRVTYFVPFMGDKDLFFAKPSQFNYNPPHADISDNEILISTTVLGTDATATKSYFEKQVAGIKEYLGWQQGSIVSFNTTLVGFIDEQLNNRIKQIKDTEKSVAELGIPIRNRQTSSVISVPPKVQSPKTISKKNVTKEYYDVSFSFAGENRDYVERCADILKTKGIKVFYDSFEKASLWGKNLVDHLADIYSNRSRFVVMFVSEHYIKKAWPTHERQHAQARALVTNDVYILPAKFDDSEVPGLPSTVSYIDLRKTTPEEFVELILKKL